MTGKQLAEKALNIAKNYKTVYMWGVFGAPVTEALIVSKAKQYPSWYTTARQTAFRKLIGKGYFGFDCVNLMKGIVWGWNGDASKTYGGASYATNGCPDYGADSMIAYCKNVTTKFDGIPVGAALWMSGHFGIYIGDGLGVECTPKWSNNVQVTAVGNIGTKAGYNTRTWTKWGLMPFITYDSSSTGTTSTPSGSSISVGDVVNFTGTKHYTSANSASGSTCKPGKAKVTAISRAGKHPYHLIHTDSASNVYGWVDAGDIGGTATSTSGTIAVGSSVKVNSGAKSYTGGSLASFVYKNTYTVMQLSGNRAVIGTGGAITAAVKLTDLTLA